jgi:hypothetical protein
MRRYEMKYYKNCRHAYKPKDESFYHCEKMGMLICPDVKPEYFVCRFCGHWEAHDVDTPTAGKV